MISLFMRRSTNVFRFGLLFARGIFALAAQDFAHPQYFAASSRNEVATDYRHPSFLGSSCAGSRLDERCKSGLKMFKS